SLPPVVVYLHDNISPAVPIKFLSASPTNNPNTGMPWWHEDDVFGYLVLAGHGMLYNCGSVVAHGPQTLSLLDAIVGPIGASAKQAPIASLYPTSLFPTPGS